MSDQEVQLVKQKADIVQLVGDRVSLKKTGRHFSALCPFHGEKSPSFTVSPEMQIYKCFGCGVGGDALSFLQAYEGMTFAEALEYLAKQVGVTLTKGYRTKSDGRREQLLGILSVAAEYYAYILKKHSVGKQALAYLKDRGVGNQQIDDFGLGYAPESWNGLCTYLISKKGYSAEDVVATGLAIQKSRVYDRFRGRVMFPLKSYTGQVVGFSGRVLNPDEKQAKYINTPETELYRKRELLFGMSHAKQAIRKKDRVVVVEGEMDVISSHRVHVKEVVAVKGSALTEQHILLIRRLSRNLILSLDADTSGQEAIARAIPLAEKHGMNLKVLQVPEGKDPDDLIRKDPGLWKEAITKSVSVYQFYIELAMKTYDLESGSGVKQVSHFLAPILGKIENGVERAFYVRKVADLLSVSETLMEQEMAKARLKVSNRRVAETVEEHRPARTLSRRERLERYVVAMALHGQQSMSVMVKSLQISWFDEIHIRRIVELLQQTVTEKMSLTQLVDSLPQEMQALVRELYALDMELMNYELTTLKRLFTKASRDLEELAKHSQIVSLSKEMSAYDGDDKGLRELERRYRLLTS